MYSMRRVSVHTPPLTHGQKWGIAEENEVGLQLLAAGDFI